MDAGAWHGKNVNRFFLNLTFISINHSKTMTTHEIFPPGAEWRCKSESKNVGPPKMSESVSDFSRSSNIFLDNFWTGH